MSNGVVHFEIPADDPEKLVSFYTTLFDWKVQKIPMAGMDYWICQTMPTDDKGMVQEPGGINGGIYKRQADERIINYVQVDSVDDYVQKARSLGATVLLDKQAIPGIGFFAQLVDPQGNTFALIQNAPGRE